MSTNRSNLVKAGVLGGIALTALTFGVNAIHAADTATGATSLVQRIAEKFNLNKDDVQKVFDEDRAQHEADHAAEMKSRLDQAVTDGKLTQEQEDKIVAKQEEMKTFMETLKDKTPEERKTAMDAKMTELKQWASDNGIPEQYARPGGPGGRRGMGRPEFKGKMAPAS